VKMQRACIPVARTRRGSSCKDIGHSEIAQLFGEDTPLTVSRDDIGSSYRA
jgi:hypothetical protein